MGRQFHRPTAMSPGTPSRPPVVLIIAGHVVVSSSERDGYVASCVEIVEAARASRDCLDFAITADSTDPARIRIYERWESEEHLLAFRGAGPRAAQQSAILDADVKRHVISSVGDP